MFGLGIGEILLIMIVALLCFGPAKLPELARTLGRTMAEFRRALDEIKLEVNSPPTFERQSPRDSQLSLDKPLTSDPTTKVMTSSSEPEIKSHELEQAAPALIAKPDSQ